LIMFYKSSLLAVAVVLLAVGNAMAADVALVHQSEVVTADAGRSKTLPDRVEHSFDADLSVAKTNLATVEAVPVEFGAAKNFADHSTVDPRVIARVPESNVLAGQWVESGVTADISPVFVDKVADLSPVVPTSLAADLTKKWEIIDAVTLNEVLLTPPRERVAQVTATEVSSEPKKWAVGVHAQASTTGFIGADVGYKFSPNLHARLGLNTVGFNTNYSSQGIDYNANFNPTNVHFLGDYFPFGGGLRLTGGLIFQNNQFNGTGKSSSTSQITLGGTTYNANDVGTVSSEGSFSNTVAPYLGIGFGTPLSPGLGFNLDAGVMFAGSPTVRLRANNISPLVPAAQQQQIKNDLATQERQTNQDIGGFNVYPVISIGVSYAF
jgi:hypothetical protein